MHRGCRTSDRASSEGSKGVDDEYLLGLEVVVIPLSPMNGIDPDQKMSVTNRKISFGASSAWLGWGVSDSDPVVLEFLVEV